jgi:hypothetical protein
LPDYRLYVLDDEGHFVRGIDLACTDDQHARAVAAGHLGGHDLELWQGRRRVEVLHAPAGCDSGKRPAAGRALGRFRLRPWSVSRIAGEWRTLARRTAKRVGVALDPS